MRNKLTKFLTSECPPKGMRQFTKTWKYAACMLLAFILGIGQMWAADITVTPPTPNNASNPYSTGLYVMSISSTAASSGAKLSSGAITTGTNGDVITIHFEATKSDMYIKTITFNSLSNGTLSSDDGTFEGQVFSATGNKNSVNVVLTSNSSKKGTVKVTNVVVNTGTNDVEVITFTGASGKNATFTSSATTSALSSISTDNSSCSVSSGKLSWANGKKIILTSGSNIKYVAFSISDGKMYGNKFSATEDTYNNANYTWSGSSKTVTLTNGTGGGREIQSLYVIIEAATKHTVTINPNGGSYASTPDGWTESAGVYTKSIASGTSFTAPEGLTKGTDDLTWKDGSDNAVTFPVSITGDITFVAQWAPHAVSDDATLKSLTVNGDAVAGFDPATIVYNVELPFGTVAVPTVAGAANDANAKSVVVTPAASLPGSTTVVVTAEDNSTKTYTINFTVSASKDILLVFKTGSTACNSTASTASQILSNNAAVSTYINPITFTNVEGDGDNGAEGGSLNVGKKAGNMFTLTPKAGYAIKALSFYAKVQDATCEYSLDGGAWTTLTSTNTGGDDCYSDIFSAAEVHEFRLRSTGTSGVWIRNMKLSITTACTPIVVSWTSEPAAEYELGKAATAIAAAANSGAAITYASDATGVIEVATDGALTLKALGTANLSASAPAGDGSLYCDASGDQISKSVKTYYLVTFDPQNGEATSSTKYYAGDAAIALPSAPSWPGHTFKGWFDAASAGTQVTSAVTPEASRTIYAQWTLDCAGATINTQPVGANYLIGRTATALNCEATAGNGGALTYTWYSCDDALGTNPVALAGAPTPSTAAAATFYYYCTVIEEGCATIATSDIVTVNVAPKDGVEIIGAVVTGNTTANVTGVYKGTASVKLNDKKIDKGDYYIYVTLKDGQTLQNGDILVVDVNTKSGIGTQALEICTGEGNLNNGILTSIAVDDYSTGENTIVLASVPAGATSIGLKRSDNLNAKINGLKVYRPMNPILTAIQFNDTKVDVTGTTIAATLPNGTDLGAMTITPTIVWNGAGTAAAANTWEWGVANTYTVTDKDGDATVYTITLTEAVPAVDPTLTYDDGAYIVGLSALDMSTLKTASTSDGEITYTIKDAGTTGAAIDGNNFTATAAGTAIITASQAATVAYNAKTVDFNVVVTVATEIDGIKLVEAGALTGKFVTARTLSNGENTVEGIAYTKYLTMSSTMTSFGNEVAPSATKGIYYYPSHKNIRFYFYVYNNQSSAKKIYIYTVDEDAEGTSDAMSANVSVDAGRHMVYADVELTKHAAVVFGVENTGTQICQIVAVESGDELLQGGEAGYSIDYNKCYISPKAGTVAVYDGIEYKLYADAKLVSAGNVQLQTLGTEYIKFHLDAPMTVNVYADNKKYYIGSECSTDDAAMLYEATGDGEFSLAAGDWYINGSGVQVKINKLAFSAPKCEQPTVVDMENIGLCEGDAFTALTVSASVTDGGTLHYQWYKHPAAGDDEAVGTDAATYTPTADGQYYVVVTNQLADHSDNSKASNMVTVEHFASAVITTAPLNQRGLKDAEVTLSVAATGKNVAYKWYTCDEDGSNEAALYPEQTGTSIEVTITAGLLQWYKVKVTSDCGNVEAMAKVEEFVPATPANVTESIVWDWTSAAWPASGEVQFTDKTEDGTDLTPAYELLADADAIVPNNAAFRSDMLYGKGQYVWRSGNKFFQGTAIKFTTEVAGRVRVYYRSTGNNKHIQVKINGTLAGTYETGDFRWSDYVDVPVGDVEIICTSTDANKSYTRIQKIEFQTPSYVRTEMLGNGVYGTICVDHNVPEGGIRGVTVYEIAGREPQYGKIAFDEVTEMEAGVPYVFIAHGNEMALYYGETKVDNPVNGNGMYGTFTAQTLTDLDGIYYFAKSALWSCVDLTSLNLPANRAYVKLSEIDYLSDPNPAPGRKRILLGVNGQNATTDLGNVQGDEVQSTKVLINGQLFILRGEKMYDATGRMVK